MFNLTDYRNWLTRNKSKATIEGYTHSVSKFLEWLRGAPMNESAVNRYIDHLATLPCSPRSNARHIYAVRNYYKFMHLEGEFRDIVIPTYQSDEPGYLTKKDLSSLIRACSTKRERAIVMLMYDAALRAGELVQVKVEDIDARRQELGVRTEKTRGKVRLWRVPLSSKTIAAVYDYRKDSDIRSGYLFPGLNGGMTTSSLRDIIGKLGDKAGLKHVSPHALRHSRATHIIQDKGGEALPYISKLLRHSSINTTMIYTHFDTKDIKKNVTEAFPDGE